MVRGAGTHARPVVRLGRVRRVTSDRAIHVRSPTFSLRFAAVGVFPRVRSRVWIRSSDQSQEEKKKKKECERERERDGERSLRVMQLREAATSPIVVPHSALAAANFVASRPRGTPSRRLALLFASRSGPVDRDEARSMRASEACPRQLNIAVVADDDVVVVPSFVCPIARSLRIRPSVPLSPPSSLF